MNIIATVLVLALIIELSLSLYFSKHFTYVVNHPGGDLLSPPCSIFDRWHDTKNTERHCGTKHVIFWRDKHKHKSGAAITRSIQEARSRWTDDRPSISPPPTSSRRTARNSLFAFEGYLAIGEIKSKHRPCVRLNWPKALRVNGFATWCTDQLTIVNKLKCTQGTTDKS